MDLQDFIKTTLMGLYKGIKDVNTEIGEDNGFLVPDATEKDYIEFDVALSVNSFDRQSGGGRLGVPIIQVGGETSTENSMQAISRIKFRIKAKHRIQ